MQTALPKKILVPTDFSNTSKAALQKAVEVAESCAAKLVVIYADSFLPPPDSLAEPRPILSASSEKEKKAFAEEELKKEIASIVPPNVEVESRVVVDDPVPAILTAAKDDDVDWIVMGTHGRSGLSRFFLGSVTESVIRQTDRPVLAIHPREV